MTGVDEEGGVRIQRERQPKDQDRTAPSRAEPRGVAAHQREDGAADTDERIGVAARAQRARVAGGEETAEPGSEQARLATLVAQVPPEEGGIARNMTTCST